MSITAFIVIIHLVSSLDSSDRSDGAMDRDRGWWKGHHHHHHSAEVAAPSIVDTGVAATSILNAIFTGVTSIAKVAAIEKALSNSNQALPPKTIYPEKPDSVDDLYDSKKPDQYQPTQPVRPNPYNGWEYDEFAKSWKYKLPTNGWVFDEVTKSWKYKLETNGWIFDEDSYSWKYRP